ncbi:unknown protein [Cronobacter turicensis z3032]|uniref:Uncharacterized protein n=1 Tax=Cronobacter turicensis (strain DSM 18703 / CCUG 55852 / LMG 23827 / z3032) TaxID=693216 RepID=C9XZQ7_CROTZ|nr:unknown protein [Cronobacter turicensis z3032]
MAEMVRMAAVPIIHRGAQDVPEERILMRTAIFIFRELKRNAIQARKMQQKRIIRSCCRGNSGLRF